MRVLLQYFLIFVLLINSAYASDKQNVDSSEKRYVGTSKLQQVFSWKQIGYDIDGVLYHNSSDYYRREGSTLFQQELTDAERFFIQNNNVPVGLEVDGDTVFVTVPRRRYGIPSTLNYVQLGSSLPLLKPVPRSRGLVSVYRPRVDACRRLWLVDTGLLEVPSQRKQIRPPAIIIFDLKSGRQVLHHELQDLGNGTPAGLVSITVDVSVDTCEDAFAYIPDLVGAVVVVFSLRERTSWRLQHPAFQHEPAAVNFTVAGIVVPWRDGVFSLALSKGGPHKGKAHAKEGHKERPGMVYLHALAATSEYAVPTTALQDKTATSNITDHIKLVASRKLGLQSGSHAWHTRTRTLLAAGVASDALLCWRADAPDVVVTLVQDHSKLVYISDLKVVGDEVWLLVNQMPRVVYSELDPNEYNFYIHKGNIPELIKGTACDSDNAN